MPEVLEQEQRLFIGKPAEWRRGPFGSFWQSAESRGSSSGRRFVLLAAQFPGILVQGGDELRVALKGAAQTVESATPPHIGSDRTHHPASAARLGPLQRPARSVSRAP